MGQIPVRFQELHRSGFFLQKDIIYGRMCDVPQYVDMDTELGVIIKKLKGGNLFREGGFKMARLVMIELGK